MGTNQISLRATVTVILLSSVMTACSATESGPTNPSGSTNQATTNPLSDSTPLGSSSGSSSSTGSNSSSGSGTVSGLNSNSNSSSGSGSSSNSNSGSTAVSGATTTVSIQNQYYFYLQTLYMGFLGRTAEVAGATYWEEYMPSMTCAQVAADIMNSSEFLNFIAGATNAELLTSLYEGLLDRAPDSSGFNFWENALNNGSITRTEVAQSFLLSSEFNSNCEAEFGYPNGAGAFTMPTLP